MPKTIPSRNPHCRSALLVLAGFLALSPFPALGLEAGEVALRFQDTPQGIRVVLEFPSRPAYQVLRDTDRVVLTLQGSFRSVPYKSRKLDGPILERFKLDRGSRQTDLLFFTGPEFASVSSFEMTAPFRLILDFQRRGAVPGAAPPGAGTPVPSAGEAAPRPSPWVDPPWA